MKNNQSDPVCVSGAGLVGALWSSFLAKRGYSVKVFERRPDLREGKADAGRSINLALSDRGWKALDKAGINKPVKKMVIPMYGRMIHDENGETSFLPYGKKNQAIFSVSRSGLNGVLLDYADKHKNVELCFEHSTEGVDLDERKLRVTDNKNNHSYYQPYRQLYGTDGAFSVVRERLMKTDRFNYSQHFIEHGYKELSIPPANDGSWQLDKHCLHIWPRKSFMLIALPNLDGSFTVTLFLAFEASDYSFERLQTPEQLDHFFRVQFPDAYECMPQLHEEFFQNPASPLVTIRCSPWNYKEEVCLLGDAAHAIVPFFGQGMNAGFEDCTILDEMMGDKKRNVLLFRHFSEKRKADADAIADMALENFVEMRDRVADERFLLKQELSKKIADVFPGRWQTRYSMVTFSHIPYAEAQELSRKHDRILEKLLENENARHLLDDPNQLQLTLERYL